MKYTNIVLLGYLDYQQTISSISRICFKVNLISHSAFTWIL